MIILSIDSGLARTGFAILDKQDIYKEGFKLLESGRILSSQKLTLPLRLLHIYKEVDKIIVKFKINFHQIN